MLLILLSTPAFVIYFLCNMSKYRLAVTVIALIIIAIASYVLIQVAKGYQVNLNKKSFSPTGILVATSYPNGAELWLDGKLKSATDNTISLEPAEYKVEIKKDGYSTWTKNLKIEKELVSRTEAYLFPSVPDLNAITFSGAATPIISPDGSKIVYSVFQKENVKKNGIWILDLGNDLPFGISKESKQIVIDQIKDFTKSEFEWSTDSKQILVHLKKESYLIDANNLVNASSLINVYPSLPTFRKQWQAEAAKRQDQKLAKLPKKLIEILDKSTSEFIFSPDENKVLYQATASAQIPENIIDSLPSSSNQKQERDIKADQIYVYDIKEDRNFLVSGGNNCQLFIGLTINPSTSLGASPTPTPTKKTTCFIRWFPTSKHLLFLESGKISVEEYDGTNLTAVYNGPYTYPYAYSWPNAQRLVLPTNLTGDINLPINLYSLRLR